MLYNTSGTHFTTNSKVVNNNIEKDEYSLTMFNK